MKVFELIDDVSEDDLYSALKDKKNNNIPLFSKVYCELKKTIPYINDIKIKVKKINGDIQIIGFRDDENNTIPLEFYSWQTWLGMSIDELSLENKKDHILILEYILREMTFVGFKDPFRKSDNECIVRLKSISKQEYQKYGLSDERVDKMKKKIKKIK